MALDTRYVPLTTIWQLFTDKDTGEFLRNGYVKFWIDTNRTVGKPVYMLTGSPPNYNYIEYGFLDTDGSWRVDVNDQGALDSIPYAFPYDADGNVELYFIKVYSADDVEQFSREGLPNVGGSGPDNTTEVPVNYVPNPQFLLHLDLPETPTLDAGQVRSPITDIAWGGWTFERPTGSTATDFITFPRFGSDVTTPDKSPRYALEVECQSPSPGDTFKDIRLKFRDVNKFSSDTDQFTFSFFSQVNSGSSLSANILLIKNFGTGGSTPTETSIGNANIGSSWTLFPFTFIFGENAGKTIGTLDDDYLQLVIRLPVDAIFDVSFDSFDLAKGEISNPTMPYTTDSQMIYRSIPGFLPIPNPDGSDLYLGVRLTPTGMEYDRTPVGKVYLSSQSTPDVGELPCDGIFSYDYSAYSSDLIPYKRLGDRLWDSLNSFYKFGGGEGFVSSVLVATSPEIKLTTNTFGSVGNTADGSTATGFTFNTVKNGTSGYGFTGYKCNDGVLVEINLVGTYINATSGTSGFTVVNTINSSAAKGLISILGILAASGLAGKYFTISNTTTSYYVWFKVDGVGTDPAPGGTGIEIDLRSTYDSAAVAQSISDSLSGREISDIVTTAASAITVGSFFLFDTTVNNYYVWYKKAGAGTDPTPAGRTGILVSLTGSETNIQVATATMIAINKKYFATPDPRGMFIRILDNGANVDPAIDLRFNRFANSQGDLIGTIQLSDNLSHNHGTINSGPLGTPAAGIYLRNSDDSISPMNISTEFSGGQESRPLNMYFNLVIKY